MIVPAGVQPEPAGDRRRVRVHTPALTIGHLVLGRPGDGVRVYGERLLDAVAAQGLSVALHDGDGHTGLDARPDVLHADVSDRLVDDEPQLWRRLCEWPGPCVVTLHDLPDPAEGVERCARRRRRYRELAAAVDGVIVSSEHERRAAATIGVDAIVVRHPVFDADRRRAPDGAGRRRAVVVTGFVHPGKSYESLVCAVARSPLPTGWSVRFAGGAAAGHEGHLRRLQGLAASLDVPLEVTGVLDDDWISEEMHAAGIGVVVHRHCSASGSLMSWVGHGRDVLALDGSFVREIAALAPSAFTRCATVDDMAAAISDRAANGHVERTAGVPASLAAATSARAFVAALTDVVTRASSHVPIT